MGEAIDELMDGFRVSRLCFARPHRWALPTRFLLGVSFGGERQERKFWRFAYEGHCHMHCAFLLLAL